VNMVINLLDSIECLYQMKTVNCSRKTLYSAIKEFYIILLVTDHFIAQITDLVIMNLTEAVNLSHTD